MRPGRPSQTALGVALGWSWVARQRSLGGLAPSAELALTERLLDSVPGGVRRARRFLRWRAISKAMLWLSELLGPGMALHMVLRKRWFADTVRAEMSGDRRQLVVLGAGLDALAACIAREGGGTPPVGGASGWRGRPARGNGVAARPVSGRRGARGAPFGGNNSGADGPGAVRGGSTPEISLRSIPYLPP